MLQKLINRARTTKSDLQKILDELNIRNYRIVWLRDYDPNFTGVQILNMGNNSIGGTHWIATYQDNYFDSFGLPPPPEVQHLQWTPLQLQRIDEGRCGQWCALWAYYAQKNDLDEFYSEFANLAQV